MTQQYQDSQTLKGSRSFKAYSDTGRSFTEHMLPSIISAYDVLLEKKKGRTPAYVKALEPLSSGTCALIVITVCLDSLDKPVNKVTLARRVGQYLLQEINYGTLNTSRPGLVSAIQGYTRQSHRARRRIDDAVKGGEFGAVDLVVWGPEKERHVGIVLLEMLAQNGILESVATKRVKQYVWSEGVQQWRSGVDEQLTYLSPAYFPLTTKPQGYDDQGREASYGTAFPTIKFRSNLRNSAPYQGELSNGANIHAADKLASVPYTVNSKVYEVMKDLWYLGHKVGDLVSSQPRVPEPYPAGGTEQEQAEWKSKASALHIENAVTNGRRLHTARQLSLIAGYQDIPLHFLWRADARGRLYPVTSTLLNPQGHDLSKALLKFHDSIAKPIGTHGLRRLMAAVAEHYGYDKVSIDARVQWSEDNLDIIRAVASRPIEALKLWRDVDAPFQFLAACIELTAALESDNPVGYVSSYISYKDGKCSGAQHWSMMLRDADTARSVALVPSTDTDTPPDLYSDVLEGVVKALLTGEADPDGYSDTWLSAYKAGLFDRSLTKAPTMTYFYGSQPRTWAGHIKEWAVSNGIEGTPVTVTKDDGTTYQTTDLSKRCFWLAKVMGDVLEVKLSSTVQGMQWMRDAAKTINKTDAEFIRWTSQSGFDVAQGYRVVETEDLSVKSKALNKEVKLNVLVTGTKVDSRAQRQGIAPNFIHSQDAAHLCLSVLSFNGPMSVIHDSFGCLLSDTDDMVSVVKAELTRMYISDVLSDLHHQWSEAYGVDMPELPNQGGLDIHAVSGSSYAFS